ncbi:MAG TPA: MFS transporter [Thermoanaerobaculia bacterium]|jgi:MFS family permease|nr:MFS transporter [Thermoanaerobaculia bacterium]
MEQLSDTPTPDAPAEERAQPGRLWNRNFFLLWQGQTISQLGNLAFSFAMMLWLKDATGSASLMGLIMFASLLPGVLLGPFGGTFADRHSRIRIALVCDLLSGAAVLALAFFMYNPRVTGLEPGAVRFAIGLLFAVSVVIGILRAFFTPALSAAIPDLVPRDRIPAANSLNQFSAQGSTLLGQAIGGLLYQVLGAPLLFLVDGVSFLYAGICAAFIRLPPREVKAASAHPFRDFLQETADGFRYLWSQPGLRDFIGMASVVNFFGMPIAVLLPFYVELYLKADDKWYGFLTAVIGAGSVAGFILAGTLRLTGRARQKGILIAMFLAPIFFGVVGMVTNAFLAMALVFLGGASLGVINVYLMSMIQMATPDAVRGRVLGVVMTLSGGLMPIGMVLGGVVGDLTHKNIPLVYAVCGGAALLATFVGAARRDLRDFLANG